jgi:hypothetical protein
MDISALSKYPYAGLPSQPTTAHPTEQCHHCGQHIVIPKWDRWNGFLLRCPYCQGLHGKPWNIKRIAMAGMFFNLFSFLFTMRPTRAILTMLGFAAWYFGGVYLLDRNQIVNGPIFMTWVVGFLLGPMILDSILFVRHQIDLEKSPPVAPVLPGTKSV